MTTSRNCTPPLEWTFGSLRYPSTLIQSNVPLLQIRFGHFYLPLKKKFCSQMAGFISQNLCTKTYGTMGLRWGNGGLREGIWSRVPGIFGRKTKTFLSVSPTSSLFGYIISGPLCCLLVTPPRLELGRLSAKDFKSSVSANSTKEPFYLFIAAPSMCFCINDFAVIETQWRNRWGANPDMGFIIADTSSRTTGDTSCTANILRGN